MRDVIDAVARAGRTADDPRLGRWIDWQEQGRPAPAAARRTWEVRNAAAVCTILAKGALGRAGRRNPARTLRPGGQGPGGQGPGGQGPGGQGMVFVVGCPRSGTSWLQDMLAGCPGVATNQESHAFEAIHRPVVAVGARRPEGWVKALQRRDLGSAEQRWVGIHWWVTRSELLEVVEAASADPGDDRRVAALAVAGVFDRWFSRRAADADVLVEKTPSHVAYVPEILSLYPHARIVEVVRDPRDVCVSFDKLAPTLAWARVGRAEQLRQWRRAVACGDELARSSMTSSVRRVRFEDLRADTEAELAGILDFAGLGGRADVGALVEANRIERFVRRRDGSHRRSGAVGSWHGELTEQDLDLVRREVGTMMSRLGYEPR